MWVLETKFRCSGLEASANLKILIVFIFKLCVPIYQYIILQTCACLSSKHIGIIYQCHKWGNRYSIFCIAILENLSHLV